jgi:hypothetical protein
VAWVLRVSASIILFRHWIRDDERERRRLDRATDRDGDAALAAYNKWLEENAGC